MKALSKICKYGRNFIKKGGKVLYNVLFEEVESPSETGKEDINENRHIKIAKHILDDFRLTVGKYPAETGGMLACGNQIDLIDTWCFDKKSVNTSASYSYDVDSMSKVFSEWKKDNTRAVGFVHSHPANYRRPSYDDIVTANELMKFFGNSFFYTNRCNHDNYCEMKEINAR